MSEPTLFRSDGLILPAGPASGELKSKSFTLPTGESLALVAALSYLFVHTFA